jgi:hypothetical protein
MENLGEEEAVRWERSMRPGARAHADALDALVQLDGNG